MHIRAEVRKCEVLHTRIRAEGRKWEVLHTSGGWKVGSVTYAHASGGQKLMQDVIFLKNVLFKMQETCTQYTWVCSVNIYVTQHNYVPTPI